MKLISSPLPRCPHYAERKAMFKAMSWTGCKETAVSHMISGGIKSVDVFVQIKKMDKYTKKEIQSVEDYLNHKSKKMGFGKITIKVYKNKAFDYYMDTSWKLFRVEVSAGWLTNSVLATMFMTFLRRKLYKIKGINTETDEFHLKVAKWLIRKLYDGDKKLLSTDKLYKYNIGFVQLATALKNKNYGSFDSTYSYYYPYKKIKERYDLAQANKRLFRRGLLRRGSKSKAGKLRVVSNQRSRRAAA